jgi:hypothetical protein
MSQVGEFPNMNALRRIPPRAPINQHDKSTIVSVFPKEIIERKATIFPGLFIVPPGTPEHPSILVVGPSSWWRDVDEEMPLLEIPVFSIQIAKSVVEDYCNGILGCDMDSNMPGLFYIPGEYNLQSLRKSYQHEIDKAIARQRNWYGILVKLADSLWARSNGNPLAISDDMRMAAKQLGLDNKDWLKNFQAVDNVRCKACGSQRNPDFPVCPVCKAVDDPEKFKTMGLSFA